MADETGGGGQAGGGQGSGGAQPRSGGAKVPRDPFLSTLGRAGKNGDPGDVVLLVGHVGDSPEQGHTRVYSDATLRNFMDVPDDSILHSEPLPSDASPLGGHFIWARKDAEVVHGNDGQKQKAGFFEGPIFREHAQPGGGGNAPGIGAGVGGTPTGPAPTQPGACVPITFFMCPSIQCHPGAGAAQAQGAQSTAATVCTQFGCHPQGTAATVCTQLCHQTIHPTIWTQIGCSTAAGCVGGAGNVGVTGWQGCGQPIGVTGWQGCGQQQPVGVTGWQGCGQQGPIGVTGWQGCGQQHPVGVTGWQGCHPIGVTGWLGCQPATAGVGCPNTISCTPQTLSCGAQHGGGAQELSAGATGFGCPNTSTCTPQTHMLGCPSSSTCTPQTHAMGCPNTSTCTPHGGAQQANTGLGCPNTSTCTPQTHNPGCPSSSTCTPQTHMLGCPSSSTCTPQGGGGHQGSTGIGCPNTSTCTPHTHMPGCPSSSTCTPHGQ
ncbi:MAG TPA: hypothetical protein VFE05_19420 [Longimicrobiaceae bacterium]|jgi:hypothetical protein|nr:hypothetical protein [Longimicrobiaceae bacterium]